LPSMNSSGAVLADACVMRHDQAASLLGSHEAARQGSAPGKLQCGFALAALFGRWLATVAPALPSMPCWGLGYSNPSSPCTRGAPPTRFPTAGTITCTPLFAPLSAALRHQQRPQERRRQRSLGCMTDWAGGAKWRQPSVCQCATPPGRASGTAEGWPPWWTASLAGGPSQLLAKCHAVVFLAKALIRRAKRRPQPPWCRRSAQAVWPPGRMQRTAAHHPLNIHHHFHFWLKRRGAK
jgi:hypothetical protein